MTHRIAIIGNSGAGKTTLAKRIARRHGIVHVELDAIYHQPNWQPLSSELMRERVQARLSVDGWVVDGNYSMVRDIVWRSANTIVWLDLPRRVVMPALIRRTLGRMLQRTELWNGNRERFRSLFDPRPEENILLWSWTRDHDVRAKYAAATTEPAWQHAEHVRLCHRHEVAEWLERLAASSSDPGIR